MIDASIVVAKRRSCRNLGVKTKTPGFAPAFSTLELHADADAEVMCLRGVLEHATAAAIFERLLSEEREIVLATKEHVVGQRHVDASADGRSIPFRKADRIGL